METGRAWALEVLGVEPLVGGRHAFMGTHNLVMRLDASAEAYLEILAVDPEAAGPGRARWFGLDEPGVAAGLGSGPRLLAWVARSDDLEGDRAGLLAAGFDPGPVFAAERDTPTGVLRWRITIRDDGARLAGGAVPTIIAWDTPSPAVTLPASGVSLERLVVRGGAGLGAVLVAAGAQMEEGTGPALRARLVGRGGEVELTVLSSRA
ncbi:MAG: VOC family protein [Chloroflexota bacterium]